MSSRVLIQSASCCHAPASTSSAKKLSRSNLVRIGLCSIATQKKSANAAEELMVHNEQASTFYQDWPNAQPSDIIPYVSSKARRNSSEVLMKNWFGTTSGLRQNYSGLLQNYSGLLLDNF